MRAGVLDVACFEAGPAEGRAVLMLHGFPYDVHSYEHIASLPSVVVVDLDLPAALAVARDTTWAAAHARHTALPTLERPDGAVIATTAPGQWKGQPVRILDLTT